MNKYYPKRYGTWAGNPNGTKPDYTRCAAEVSPAGNHYILRQCSRKAGHGPDGCFCKTHAKRFLKDEK